MSNLTQSEREGLNELFCQMKLANLPLYKRLLLRLNHLLLLVKTHLSH
ncbi:hypothetical protein [Hydrogenimonas sp.]|nr:hypothetical protein [Hydrogenimonas sp.]